MEYLHLQLGQYGNYILRDSTSRSIEALASFLEYGFMYGYSSDWKEWVLDQPSQPYRAMCAEFTELTKENGNICISAAIDDEERALFILSKQAFANMLDDWKKILEAKPKEVFVYFDGEKVTFKTKD